jgi:hypothetical protein
LSPVEDKSQYSIGKAYRRHLASVTGWCGGASVLTFQTPTHREESHHVGNIHYRHLPGYRLEVKTAGSGVSSQSSCAALPLVVGEFLIFLGWNGRETGHSEVQRKPAGKRIRTSWGALFASREVEARYRCRARESGIAAESIQETRTLRRRALQVDRPKLEAAKRATARGSRLESVDVTFLLLRRARLSPSKRGMIVIVGSTDFGRL